MSFKVGDKVRFLPSAKLRYEYRKSENLDIPGEVVNVYAIGAVEVRLASGSVYDYASYEVELVKEKTNPVDPKKELVNSPDHYKSSGMEAIDVIESFNLGFNLGNTVKYILRCGKKDSELQELKKAKWYLEREISRREKDV